uniref:Uncharacterized protein n=1 Tax=Xiphophorus couchianus TaxID=32473 RepID=A0A3B5L401_9TELE
SAPCVSYQFVCSVCFDAQHRLNDLSIITPFSRDDRGHTPLHAAAMCGQAQLIDLLVHKGALVNATDYHALTPLHLACQRGYQGVSVSVKTQEYAQMHFFDLLRLRLTPLVCCPSLFQLLLLHYKANTEAQDNNGNTPLHLACMYGHEDVLLENGASTHILNKNRETPLQCALNSKVSHILKGLNCRRTCCIIFRMKVSLQWF